uniref:C2H2-type domain-containing protein n=1 Tax=Daphnia galeata TaxID=27404 RepID=A0A8J2S075_9CRUS|nr:unnamed protein product [Daphnia galeata]
MSGRDLKGRGRGRVTQYDEVVAVSNQEGASEITPSNERSGVQDIIHSVSLEQDIIEASILQLNKKKKEANQESEWKTRMKDKEDAWDSKRDAVFQNYISSCSYSVSKCGVCEKVTNPVRCFTCKQDFCSKCDMITHRKLVLHNREVCENGENLKFLRQNEFISEDGYITVEVSLPLLVPSCPECKSPHSCTTKPGSRDVAVVTANAKPEDYFASGFQPSSDVDETSFYLICTDLLDWCWHFQHKMPGISMNKIVETIQEISEQHNRCTSLSNTEFLMAIREYEFNRIRIQKEILRVEHMKCKACGAKPLACHVDGNMKCYRCGSAQGHGAKELLENVAIARNDDVEAFVAEVNKAIPETKGNATCGGSTFKAGKCDSHSHSKNTFALDTFAFDIENGIEDLLLDNIQEDGDEENEAYEEDSEEKTADYQDYSDEETNDYQDYADEGNEEKLISIV